MKFFKNILPSLRVGWLLGRRQLQRSNKWLTILIVAIMTLTFVSNVVISGILVGLIEGGTIANKEQYTGDVFISTKTGESTITNSTQILATLNRLPQVENYTARFSTGATIEANYQTRRDFNALPNNLVTSIVGIDPDQEDAATGLSNFIIDGEYLDASESGYILAGAVWLEQYSQFGDLFEPLRNVEPGVRIKVSAATEGSVINQDDPNNLVGVSTQGTQEFVVKGIVETKVNEVSGRFFVTKQDFLRLVGRTNLYPNEIAVNATAGTTPEALREVLERNNLDRFAKVRTAEESIPQFLDQIQDVFGTLGFMIGFILAVVGAITVFIVIYINALVRRKQIGILKGIGITNRAIIASYTFQSITYALVGIVIGMVIVLVVLVPFFQRNPLDFPFADGILVVDAAILITGIVMVLFASVLAGFIPSWLIVKKNTLDSILGRN